MITTILFDTDGVVVRREMYFSQRFSQEFNVPIEKVLPFFKNEFQLCLAGKADLKKELTKYLDQWNWKKSVDGLLLFWFEHESNLNNELLRHVAVLRNKGIHCYMDTNNETYRVQYLLNNLGLKNVFDGTFVSSELGYLKPQQEFWSAIYDRLGKPTASTVFVWDDDEENVTSARQFGFQSELYTDFDAYEKRMRSY